MSGRAARSCKCICSIGLRCELALLGVDRRSGAGKSALLEALRAAGHSVMDEAGRAIIQDQALIGGRALPWVDPRAFAEAMLGWELRSLRLAAGLPRCSSIAACPMCWAISTCSACRFPLICKPPPSVFPIIAMCSCCRRGARYSCNPERKQSFAEAERTCAVMERTYRRLGYHIIEVPPAPLAQRLSFIIEQSLPTAGCGPAN